WLGIPHLAMGSVITVHVWRLLPLATVIILAGLTSIPQDIHDAAAVDGVGFWRHLFQVTLPLVRPIMLVAALFGLVFAFTDMINRTHNPFIYTEPAAHEHLRVLFAETLYARWLGNTLLVGLIVVAITLVLALPAGYALARLTGRWGEQLGIGIFLTYLVPPT